MRKMIACVLLAFGAALSVVGQDVPAFLPQDGVVLFQGDSITDGGRQRTGNDYNHIMGQDYAYLLAAELGLKYPQRNVTFLNRGVGSSQVTGMAERWKDDTLALKPDVLSILMGVNDSLATGDHLESVGQFEAVYDKLLAETIVALPKTRIVLGLPFLLPVGRYKEGYEASLALVRQRSAVVVRLGAKYHLPVVDYQKAFDRALKLAPADHWCWDGVHPTYAGHALMAQTWLETVSQAWAK